MITTSVDWTASARALWERIAAHSFDDGAAQGFVHKLMLVQGWSRDQALAAIAEYRRYCFLACVDGIAATPSDEVDEVWHLHLTYTRDYWNVWCGQVLGMTLHHEPSRGGSSDLAHHRRQYAQTLARYEQWFGAPPLAWWPGSRERFVRPQRFRRVDTDRVWLLPRWRWVWRRGIAAVLALTAMASAASALAIEGTPLDWSGSAFLKLYLVALLATTVAAVFWRRALRENGARPSTSGLGALEAAYLVGGPARCLDTAVADLLSQKIVRLDQGENRFVVGPEAGNLPAPTAALRRLMIGNGRSEHVFRQGLGLFDEVGNRLRQLGLLLDTQSALRAAWLPALLPGLVLLMGVAKVYIGIQRDRPVGFLVMLCLVALVVTLFFALRLPSRSRAGDQAIAGLHLQHARAARAPRESELPLAVALLGTTAMVGTAWAGYHSVRSPPSSTSSSDSSSSSNSGSSDSGSSDGGDSGGGGCGGCGGGGGD